MPELIAEQGSEEWLRARLGKVTASLAAACLGLDPHTSRQKAWRTILGTEPKRDNRHMKWGREFEAQARADYECERGVLVATTGFWVHPEHDWLGASPDGLVGTDGLVEIKAPGEVPDAVPPHHQVQVAVQMAVTGRLWCDYFAWTHAGSFICRVERCAAAEAKLLADLEAFYRNHVLTAQEPPRKRKAGAA